MAPPTAVDVHAVADTTAIVLPDPLTVNGVSKRRTAAGKLNGGVAAKTSSDLFKGLAFHGKPKAKRWDHYINEESASRRPGSLKGAAKYLGNPGLISLGGGLPSSCYFPLEHVEIKVPAAGKFSEEETRESGVTLKIGKNDVSEGKSVYDLSICLNYGLGTGSAQLLRFVTEHTEIVHKPPYRDWHCNLTVGNTSALDIAFRMFVKRGDYILFEEYTFCSAVETAAPMGVKAVGIKMDDQGLLPSDMDSILSNWDVKARGARKPFLLYTVPSGQNPTGATQSLERRQELYRVAQKHDVYIIEDEPYYFLQMQPYTGAGAPPAPLPKTHEEFLEALVPSLLSMDVDGRVMRLDSFSKIIAPGTRVGWITACEQLVERFVRHQEVSVQNPSGLAQIVLYKLLDESWGHGGFLDWLVNLRKEYTQRRDVILGACEMYLPGGVVKWTPPAAGMFLWIQVDWKAHPQQKSHDVIEDEIFKSCIEKNVLLTPGSWFCAEQDAEHEDMFFRATFAAAGNEQMKEGVRRFGEAVRKVFRMSESEKVSVNGVEA